MHKFALLLYLVLIGPAIASDEADVWINEIFFLHDAEGKWREYAERTIRGYYDQVTYPEQYQAEFDAWLANDLAWINVEPAFRAKLKATYSNEELMAIVDSLRQYPSGYPEDPAIRGVGPQLFNLGVEVGNRIYMPLSRRFRELREQYEPTPEEPPADDAERLIPAASGQNTRMPLTIPPSDVPAVIQGTPAPRLRPWTEPGIIREAGPSLDQ